MLFGRGPFDPTPQDVYGALYAGDCDRSAVAEGLLRDVDANDRGARCISKKYWSARQLSRIQTTAPITSISIRSGVDLGRGRPGHMADDL